MFILLGVAFVLVFILLGLPIPFCFMGATLILVTSLGYKSSFLIPYSYSITNAVVLLCVPLYIAVGAIMERGNIGKVLVDFVALFIGKIKGSIGIVAVVASAVFGSISGSCAATLSCIGSILMPKFLEKGYPRSYCAALLSCACPLGLLIPPSASMILYAWVGRQSILACFLATVGPGVLLMLLLSLGNVFYLRNNPSVMTEDPLPPGEFIPTVFKRTKTALPALFMPFIILGGIYGGIFTPTEAAAIAVFYAIPVGFFVYKGLTLQKLRQTFIETSTTTGVVMVMIFCIVMLSRIYIMEDIPGILTEILMRVSENKNVILIAINLILIVIGMIMDDVSAMLLCTPIFLPVVMNFGVNPVHFGAIIGINLGLGLVTPPAAPMLYLGGRVGKAEVSEMLRPTLFFIATAWFPTLVAVTYFPGLSLWLPNLVLGGKF